MLLLLSVALASPKSFTRDFAAALETAFPECTAVPAGKLMLAVTCEGGDELSLRIVQLYGTCRANPAVCAAERSGFLRSFDEALHPTPPTVDRVIPGVRPRSVLEGAPGEKVYSEAFGGDLVVVYLVDSPTTMRYLNRDELSGLGVAPVDLLATTRPNVKSMVSGLEVEQRGPLLWVTGSVYASSILLETSFWERLSSAHGEVYAAAPARDVLLVLGTEAADDKAPELLRLAAAAVVSDPSTIGAMTADVFHWKAGVWELQAAPGKPGR